MLREAVIDSISNKASSIFIDWSRCLRMRFNKSNCIKCLELCKSRAIIMAEGIDIRRENCSECMLCVSECPSGCFGIKNADFYFLIARLKKVGSSALVPVLGCKERPDLKAHVRTFCFGFLSEEHILALFVYLNEGLQINLAGCSDCRNGFIVDILKKRIETIAEKASIDIADKITLVEKLSDLRYQDISYDRREFFRVLRNRTFLQAAELLENNSPDYITSGYSEKRLPFRRELLNKVFKSFSDENRNSLLASYYYSAYFNENCNNCFACVGMCPTGALKISTRESDPKLTFNSSLCSGCGLCEGFCMNNAILIKRGFRGAALQPLESLENVNG